MNIKITERGWAGHLICSDNCKFRRNTLVEYEDKRIVVSTVGCMINPITHKAEQIGLDRYYETMVFWAKWEDPYWEADVSREIDDIDIPWGIEDCERGSDLKANEMHENVVKEVIKNLLSGNL